MKKLLLSVLFLMSGFMFSQVSFAAEDTWGSFTTSDLMTLTAAQFNALSTDRKEELKSLYFASESGDGNANQIFYSMQGVTRRKVMTYSEGSTPFQNTQNAGPQLTARQQAQQLMYGRSGAKKAFLRGAATGALEHLVTFGLGSVNF